MNRWNVKKIVCMMLFPLCYITGLNTIKPYLTFTTYFIFWILYFCLLFSISLYAIKKYKISFHAKRMTLSNYVNELVISFILSILVLSLVSILMVGVDSVISGNLSIVKRESWIEKISEKSIRTIVIIIGITIGPISEEMFFRGFLYSILKSKVPIFYAMFLQSLIFTVVHQYDIRDSTSIFLFGIAFAVIYEKRKTLLSSIYVHIITNLIHLIA